MYVYEMYRWTTFLGQGIMEIAWVKSNPHFDKSKSKVDHHPNSLEWISMSLK